MLSVVYSASLRHAQKHGFEAHAGGSYYNTVQYYMTLCDVL